MHSFHRPLVLELGDQVDAFLRAQIDDVDALLPKPKHAALGVNAVAHDHLAEAELVNHAGAIPAGSQRRDQDGVVPGRSSSGSSEGVGLAM